MASEVAEFRRQQPVGDVLGDMTKGATLKELMVRLGHSSTQQLFATYAFDIGMGGGQLGLGASIALTMLPALALLILALTLYMRRQ